MRDSSFTLGRPETEASQARLGSGVGLSGAQRHLYVICCLEHRALVGKYALLMTLLQRHSLVTSDTSLVQIADVNVEARAQLEPSPARAKLGL